MRPPRVYSRQTVPLRRRRERTSDLESRTLYFTFPGATKSARSCVTFVDPMHVPAFEGDEAWFEVELVAGTPWSYWRAVRQVEPPANA